MCPVDPSATTFSAITKGDTGVMSPESQYRANILGDSPTIVGTFLFYFIYTICNSGAAIREAIGKRLGKVSCDKREL